MKLLVKFVLLLFLPVFAFGQNANINDSLKLDSKTTLTDSAVFNLNYQLFINCRERNRDSALNYLEKCLTLAQRNNKRLDESLILSHKGFQLTQLSKFSESYEYIYQAYKITENPRNESKIFGAYAELGFNQNWTAQQMKLFCLANIHSSYGNLLSNMGKIDQSFFYHTESKKVSKTIQDSVMLGFANGNLGYIYFEKDKLDSALVLEQNAEQMFIKTNIKTYLGWIYYNIGLIFLKQHKNEQAVQYFHRGIESAKASKIGATLGANYSSLFYYYFSYEKNRDSSLSYALKWLNVLESIGSKDLGWPYYALAESYELNNKKDSAFKYNKLALFSLNSASNARIESLTKAQTLAFDDQLRLKASEKVKADAQNKIRTWELLSGLLIMALIGFILYRNNLKEKKGKAALEKTHAQLKSTQNQLIQSEKLASLGELTAGIAHEIQNPMNFVNNFSEFSVDIAKELNEALSKPNFDKEYVAELLRDLTSNQEKITFHGKRASSIVKGMLGHSRTSTGKKELTDINALVDESLRLAFHGLRAKDKTFNAEMITLYDPTNPKIEIVPQDIGRVVLNLINNAFYAVNERGRTDPENGRAENLLPLRQITQPSQIAVGAEDFLTSQNVYKSTVTVQTSHTTSHIEIRIKDNGTGIPDAVKEKIFQPFFTTKPTGSGTGLGLSLAYDIITKGHGGKLTVESKEGVGAEFIISLPLI